MTTFRFLAVLLLAAASLPALSEPTDLRARQYLLPEEAAAIDQPVVFLDVRSQQEWDSGHIKDALHIPFKQVPSDIASLIPDRAVPIVVYCESGGRARYVINSMRSLGYTAVPVVKGGYRQLVGAGMKRAQ